MKKTSLLIILIISILMLNAQESKQNSKIRFMPFSADCGINIGGSKVIPWNKDPEHFAGMLDDVWCLKIGPLYYATGLDYIVVGNVLGFPLSKCYSYDRFGLMLGTMSWCTDKFLLQQAISIGITREYYKCWMSDSSGNHIGWTNNLESQAHTFAQSKYAWGCTICYRIGMLSFNMDISSMARSYHVMLVVPFDKWLYELVDDMKSYNTKYRVKSY